MERDRVSIHGRRDRLQLRASPLPCDRLEALVEEPTDRAALMAPAHRYEVDVSGGLGLRPEGEEVGDDRATLTDDPCRIAELADEHRVMCSARALGGRAPELLERCDDLQVVLDGAPLDGGPRIRWVIGPHLDIRNTRSPPTRSSVRTNPSFRATPPQAGRPSGMDA